MALTHERCAESQAMMATARLSTKATRTRIANSQALIAKTAQHLECSRLSSPLSADIETDVLERMHEMTVRFLHTHSVTALLEDALEALMRVTAAPLGNVQLLHGAPGVLNIAVQQGFRSDFLDFFAEVPAFGSACGLVLRHRCRVIVRNVATDAGFTETSRRAMLRADAHAVQSTPLVARSGNVMGVVSTHYREPLVATARARRIIDLYAHQVATLMESVVLPTGFSVGAPPDP